MLNMKKFLATSLALSMVVGASALPSQALTKDELVAGVEYQLSTNNYSTDSMVANAYDTGNANYFTCNFHTDAEVEVDEDEETFTLTLYFANDENIEFFRSQISFAFMDPCEVEYNGTKYPGDVLASYDNLSAPQKRFEKTSTMVVMTNVTAGETYGCDVITVSGIPVEALEDDGLKFNYSTNSAFGGNPINMTQKLETGIVLDYEEVSDDEDPSDETPEYDLEENQGMDFGVQVENTNDPTYTVTIPEQFDLQIADGGASSNYTVAFEMDGYASVTVSAETKGELTSEDTEDTLAYTNSFATTTYTATGSQMGQISISAEDVKAVESGYYDGTVNFHFGFSTEGAESE